MAALLNHVIKTKTAFPNVTLIPFGCIHADDPGFVEDRWAECVEEIKRTPECYAIGLGDYKNFLRTTARKHLKSYTADEDSWLDLDQMVKAQALEFVQKWLMPIRHKLIGLAEGNHFYQFSTGGTDTQFMCERLEVPYLDKPAFVRLQFREASSDRSYATLKMLVHHGDWSGGYSRAGGDVNSAEMKALGFDFDIYIFSHCFDDQTEALTPDGWAHHDALQEGTLVMTYNREKTRLEWQPCEAVHRYSHFNEMVKLRARDIDLAVTEDHGLWVGKYQGDHHYIWQEMTAGEAYGQPLLAFQLTAEHDEEHLPLSDSWIRLLAWIMAEGSLSMRGSYGPYLRLAQSDAPDGRLAILQHDLEGCGLRYTIKKRYHAGYVEHGQYRNYDAYVLTVLNPQTYRETVLRYLDRNKTPTVSLAGMSVAQMRLFLDTYVLADGSTNHDALHSRQIASKRRDHIDWLQQIACRSGHRTSVSTHDGMWYLTLNARTTTHVTAVRWSREHYDGVAWCVTVPNGALLIRRGGHTAITLNTHRLWGMHIPHITIPMRGHLRTIERPRAFIRSGCFVKGYPDRCNSERYASKKLLNPTAIGYAKLLIHFSRSWDSEKYKQSRTQGRTQREAKLSAYEALTHRFQVLY